MRKFTVMALVLLGIGSGPAIGDDGYRKPPEIIQRMLDAPPAPYVSVNEPGTHMLFMHRVSLPPIADLAQPMWRLAGYRINPDTNGRHGVRRVVGLSLRELGGKEVRLALPDDVDVGFPTWSPGGRRFAFTVTHADRIELWVGDTRTGKVKRLTDRRLNGAAGSAFQWVGNNRLLCRLVPEGRGDRPEAPRIPAGPNVQETSGRSAPVRTYQDLLQNPHDEARFEWVMTSQLALVDLQGNVQKVGEPEIFSSISVSPDQRYWLVTRIVKPYSYLVPAYRFPRVVEVWNEKAEVVRELVRQPLGDSIPIGGVMTGPRSFQWAATSNSTLVWAEALDEGDPKKKVPHRDQLYILTKPYTWNPVKLTRLEHRFRGLDWLGDDTSRCLVSEYDRDRRWSRTWLVGLPGNSAPPRLIWDRSTQDRYGDPGRPVAHLDSRGRSVIRVEQNAIFLTGSGASDAGDRPFLDRLDLATLKTTRLWQSRENRYESVTRVLSPTGPELIIRSESRVDPPNYYRWKTGGAPEALTSFADPQPEMRKVHKELVTYEREDGVKLSATLYLPPGHRPGDGKRLPLIVWAYPREFNNPKHASQVRGSPHRFTTVGGTSHLFLLTQGYAIMDGAAMPVVGEVETANDTFVEQLVSSARAAIDKAASMGVADRRRVGVGGHSYGAFMTANLLAHSDLFQAGIARSGAYNRTLTPFGFQNERRTFWEAPEIYFGMSPFMHAHKINEPMLLVHGERDNNSGTFPIQSKRLYHAMKGHGGTARLVMLPYESHGYRARESVLHVLAESVEWFDRHVKGNPVEAF